MNFISISISSSDTNLLRKKSVKQKIKKMMALGCNVVHHLAENNLRADQPACKFQFPPFCSLDRCRMKERLVHRLVECLLYSLCNMQRFVKAVKMMIFR